jgi:transposase
MAHAVCYFLAAEKNDQKKATYAMDIFSPLYDIKREIKDKSTDERMQVNLKLAKPIWLSFGKWLGENAGKVNDKSAIHKTFAYTMKRYKRFALYMDNGLLNIDNTNRVQHQTHRFGQKKLHVQ